MMMMMLMMMMTTTTTESEFTCDLHLLQGLWLCKQERPVFDAPTTTFVQSRE